MNIFVALIISETKSTRSHSMTCRKWAFISTTTTSFDDVEKSHCRSQRKHCNISSHSTRSKSRHKIVVDARIVLPNIAIRFFLSFSRSFAVLLRKNEKTKWMRRHRRCRSIFLSEILSFCVCFFGSDIISTFVSILDWKRVETATHSSLVSLHSMAKQRNSVRNCLLIPCDLLAFFFVSFFDGKIWIFRLSPAENSNSISFVFASRLRS